MPSQQREGGVEIVAGGRRVTPAKPRRAAQQQHVGHLGVDGQGAVGCSTAAAYWPV